MRLLIREYLGMLKESGEFDVLFPDLLRAMRILPLSAPQVGVRQAGVDLAAVGNDEDGAKTLWLFVLKRGDIGRTEWDSGPQAVRQSLNEIEDSFLRNNVRPEHQGLPIKIVVATTGDFKQDNEQERVGYTSRRTQDGRRYEFWNGDKVAALVEEHLLDEHVLPAQARSNLRRALALIGESDYDLEHYYAILKELFAWEVHEAEKPAKKAKLRLRALATANLALGILWHWAQQEDNLRSAAIAAERTLLWAWDAIRKHDLGKHKKVRIAYYRLVQTYLDISTTYFNKVQPHLHERNALARYYRESSMLNERVFEEIGRVATLGLSHFFFGYVNGDVKAGAQAAKTVAETLQAFLRSHPTSGSPCYDNHCIEIALALTLFCFTEDAQAGKDWLEELIPRLTYAFRIGKWFPISTDSFDDLVAFEVDRHSVDLEKLKEMSWLIPTVAQWAVVLGAHEAYAHLAKLQTDALKETDLQLWYPDEGTDALRYGGPAHMRSGITEAPIRLPATAQAMRDEILELRAKGPIRDQVMTSAARAGIPFIDFIACRHFRIPVDPAFWQKLLSEAPQTTSAVPPGAPTATDPQREA